MASFFRSISIKIFGIAVGLLVIMAAAALWSANLTNQVHLQLQTLSRSQEAIRTRANLLGIPVRFAAKRIMHSGRHAALCGSNG